MTPGGDPAATLACHKNGQVFVVMTIPIADAGTVNNHTVIEQGTIPFWNGFHLLQDVGGLLHVEGVDFADLGLFGWIILMMGE